MTTTDDLMKRERYKTYLRNGVRTYEYKFKDDETGMVFSCEKTTLELCREARDKWLKKIAREAV